MGKVTNEKINQHWRDIRKLEAQIKSSRALIEAEQALCDHENEYPTSCMGDNGTYCPDCGEAT